VVRNIKLDAVPAELVERIEVFKTLSATVFPRYHATQVNFQGAASVARRYTVHSHFATFERGLKIRDSHTTQNQNDLFYNFNSGNPITLSSVVGSYVNPSYYDHSFQVGTLAYGPSSDYSKITRAIIGNLGQFQFDPVTSATRSASAFFDADESVYAGYLQNAITFGKFRQTGVRFEGTSTNFTTNQLTRNVDSMGNPLPPTITPLRQSSGYVKVLPSVQLQYQLEKNTHLRANYSQGISRPNIGDLVPRAARYIPSSASTIIRAWRSACAGHPLQNRRCHRRGSHRPGVCGLREPFSIRAGRDIIPREVSMKACASCVMAVCAALLLVGSLAVALPSGGAYHLLQKYAFAPAEGSTREYFDYITVDSASRRVYLSHGTEVKVIDADSGAVVGNITGFKQNHGVALAGEFGRGFVTDGALAKVVIFDLQTLKVIGEAKAAEDADSIIYDPASKRIFVMNGDPHSCTVVDAKTGNVAATIDMGGAPEFAVADGKGTLYANLEDKNVVVAIDTRGLTIKSRWPLAPAGTPTAIAMDLQHRRLFSAGRNPQMLVVMDADSGKVIQSLPISAGVDAAVFEPETGLLFVSTREGLVHIFHEDSPDKLSVVDSLKTEFGAKTMGLDTKTHRLFLDTADFGPPPAPTAQRPHPQPAPILGTFHLLVYGQQDAAKN
jgi:YVTN family beta-propeller protein